MPITEQDVQVFAMLEGLLVPLGVGLFKTVMDSIHTPSKEAGILLDESDISAAEMIKRAQESKV
jgi:hypothetical protein